MKKVILILIALSMVTALCSCGNAVAASITDFDINGELVKSQNYGVKLMPVGLRLLQSRKKMPIRLLQIYSVRTLPL